MNRQDLQKQKKLPDKPGVYLFKDGRGSILYIGKATSLRDRTQSYFGDDLIATRGPLLVDMVTKAKKVDFIETDSVLEALILEVNLIKKHQPHYNTKEKSDKSFNYVVITKEDFPRVFTMRGRELRGLSLAAKHGGTVPVKLQTSYGPFPHGGTLKEALNIIRKIFPFRDKRAGIKGNEVFYKQLGLAPDMSNKEAQQEYKKTIRNIKLFFKGKKGTLLKKLKNEMNDYAKKQAFEKANSIKKQIFALEHIQDIALIREDSYTNILPAYAEASADRQNVGIRIEAYDVAHIGGKSMVGVMTVVEDGVVRKSEYRKFSAKGGSAFGGKTVLGKNKPNDTGALKEILDRRFGHPEWKGPGLIIVDGGKAQKNTAERVLKNLDLPIPVVAVVKDKYHRPKNILGDKKLIRKFEKDILLANNEAHRFSLNYHRNLQRKTLRNS